MRSTSPPACELYEAFVSCATTRRSALGGPHRCRRAVLLSAGWDLKAAAEGEAVDAEHCPGGFAGLTEFFDVGKPVIAAVNGLAFGGGFELALSADLIVAADHAEFALPEVQLGIVADSGGLLRIPARVPRAIALEWLLTGRRIPADELLRWGVVNRVVPAADLMSSALELAERDRADAPPWRSPPCSR